ncbi:MAG: hypothetical protein IKC03_01450, partial [Oscillospiraceae bacterium]|nr:hypothetical protein [Oscillospiraceae bacterium]
QFKQGIFSLRTNFGELAQLMIQKYMRLHPSNDNSYDLKDDNGHRIEVKFSRAYKKDIPITEKNVLDLCLNYSTMVYASTESEKKSSDYDCNIQQLKPDCFDSLYYGVFFSDKIEIFHAPRSVFPDSVDSFLEDKAAARKKLPGYALQHKGGEECQFHIKKTTHKHHRKHYHIEDLTYEELYDLLNVEE